MANVSPPAPVPKFWKVRVFTSNPEGPKWLALSRAGAKLVDDYQARALADGGPCVYVVPEDDTPEESERMDAMPGFKLLSSDGWVLTGPQRDKAEPGDGMKKYEGGAAATTNKRDDGRDRVEAYPAPVDDKFSSDVYPFYLWSPSRQAPLVVSSSGKLTWDAGISSRVVTNFGKTQSLTVWQLVKVGDRS